MLHRQAPAKAPSQGMRVLGSAPIYGTKLFDTSIVDDPRAAVDFITNILESSTKYSIVAAHPKGKILLWNEGARRLCRHEPEGNRSGNVYWTVFHTSENVEAGLQKKMTQETLHHRKFEGTVTRRHRNGDRFIEQVVNTLRHDRTGRAIGFLLISSRLKATEVAFVSLGLSSSRRPERKLYDALEFAL